MDGNWDGVPDLEFADDIIRRCVKLVPELGTFEEVKGRVLMHGVGLRRKFPIIVTSCVQLAKVT